MAILLINHADAQSPVMDTTGATLLVAVTANGSSVSDSKGNTWHSLTPQSVAAVFQGASEEWSPRVIESIEQQQKQIGISSIRSFSDEMADIHACCELGHKILALIGVSPDVLADDCNVLISLSSERPTEVISLSSLLPHSPPPIVTPVTLRICTGTSWIMRDTGIN
jgi:hypothetical protein